MKNLLDFSYEDLTGLMASSGEKPYRATQLYAWLFKRTAPSIDSMTDISKEFRERLKENFYIGSNKVLDVLSAPDGTRKFLSELEDGARIESVVITEEDRVTLCVSTQAGCALGCAFCMTGEGGFTRNLKLSELAGQVISARGLLKEGEKITNVVLMGMGEPLANYDNVLKFTRILVDGKGFGFSHNKVTLSTAGLIPMIKRLGEESNVNLAVSLNATTDEVRSRLMPINKKYPLKDLLSAMKGYPLHGKKYITIEYVLIKGVNDTPEDALRLVKMLRSIPCKINLIPFNPYPGSTFQRPDEKTISSFWQTLKDAGYTAIVRWSKGAEIQAACGQLKGV